jgi:hypothetical protein
VSAPAAAAGVLGVTSLLELRKRLKQAPLYSTAGPLVADFMTLDEAITFATEWVEAFPVFA